MFIGKKKLKFYFFSRSTKRRLDMEVKEVYTSFTFISMKRKHYSYQTDILIRNEFIS